MQVRFGLSRLLYLAAAIVLVVGMIEAIQYQPPACGDNGPCGETNALTVFLGHLLLAGLVAFIGRAIRGTTSQDRENGEAGPPTAA